MKKGSVPIKASFLMLIFSLFFLHGKSQHYEIKRLGLEQGISSTYVVSITQDKKGFLWFATEEGLNRFDGNKFKVYKKSKTPSTVSVSGNELNMVYADRYDEVVWIATQREGLNMFDCNTETFTYYRHDTHNPSGIITNDITDITHSKDGNLWITTYYEGVEYFDKKSKTFRHYNDKTIPGLVSNLTWCVNEDNKGFLYIGHVNSGLSILSLKDNKVKNFRHNPADKESLPGNEVRAICIDNNDNVWIGTNKGLALYQAEKESFIVFRHHQLNNTSLSSDYIYSINQLDDGRLWIGTENGGVSILNIGQNMFLNPLDVILEKISYSDDSKGFSNSTIRSIYQDSFNNIWFGTYGGGVNFISHRPPMFNTWMYSSTHSGNTLSSPIAWGICADSDDRIWIGTDGGGINVFADGEKLRVIDSKTSDLSDDAILAAIKDSRNNLWFGTFKGGVNVFDYRSKVLSRFSLNGNNTDVRCFYEDRDKHMWIGCGSGLCQYNISTAKKQFYNTENSDLPNNLVRAISKDDEGNIWVGFFGEGLAILDKDFKILRIFKTDRNFPSNTVNYIFKDSYGKMWIATGGGLVCFNRPDKNYEYVTFDEEDGLINTHIRAVTEDSEGNIWFSTNNGICRLIPETNQLFNYDHSHGIPRGNFLSGSVTRDSNGRIFFGSQNGVCYFDPLSIPRQMELSPTIITGFSIYDTRLKLSANEVDIPVKSGIELSYNQNTFSISYNVLDYAINQITEHAYMLKGLNNSWYNTQGENVITFRDIPPGSYTLLIKSRIKNQDWSDNITSLKIEITPPFWLTWWAKTGYTLIIILVAFFVLRFYKRKLDLENSLILEKKNHQQEHALNDERLRFFTNITHELRTPLTLILGPIEDMNNDTALSEKHRAKMTLIYRSATRLRDLINQILEFRKTETQNKKLTVCKNNLSMLIEEIGLKYKELNINKTVTFDAIIENPDIMVYYDTDIVTTIMDNLLSNAFKYTRAGNITLTLREITENEFNYAEIEVRDTGRGISAESLPRIFDRYYQAVGDGHVSGTGIGLALVHNLVSLHQGEIFVDSKKDEGTSFRFRLKTENTYPDALHLDAQHEPVLKSFDKETEKEEGKPIVLAVEDNEDILNYISSSLSDEYQIHTAINGRDGLEKAFSQIPDIIVSDIMMPEMDGFELSRTLKEDVRTSHIPIILLTAKDTIHDRKEGYETGVDSYIVKPFSADLLKSRIKNLLEARKKLADLINKNTINKSIELADSLSKIDHAFIEKVTSVIEENLDSDKVDVVFIAGQMNMSHSTLYRKIKGLSGISVNEFIRKVRIHNAEKLLLTGKYSISEISYKVGMNSVIYFRQCFKEEFGLPPSEYIKKIQHNASS